MPQLSIVPHGDSAAVILPTEVLDSAGLRIGDVVDVSLGDHQLVMHCAKRASRRELIEKVTREVFEKRRDDYQRLA